MINVLSEIIFEIENKNFTANYFINKNNFA